MTEEARAHPLSRARVAAGVICLAISLLLAGLLYRVQRSGDQRDRAAQRIEHSFLVMLSVNQVQVSMARAEAALGRFVIDGDRRTGTSYYDEWRHAGEGLRDLQGLLRDNRAQVARLEQLQALYATRGRELALPATRATYKQGWPALSLYYAAARSRTLPEISRVMRQIVDAENTLLDSRALAAAARTDHSNDLTRLLSLVGVLLALSVMALVWLVLSALAERRLATETAEIEADRAATLERAVADRTAELSAANLRLEQEAATRADAEAKLRQIQKMEAVGQLTGGIAHDFNNMLAVVLGGLEMAKRRVGEQAGEALRHIDNALEGAERAAALTRRLLSFARAQPLLPAAIDPGALLHGMSDLLDRTLGERVDVRIKAEAEVWPVWVDAYQLENAVLNLAVNARDAVAGAGMLVMSAANARLRVGAVGALPAGEYVRIAVEDDGAGIAPDVLERVFEPFFTTKQAGQGTGLGLSQILGFARQSGGDVAIASRLGVGTVVSILLPRFLGPIEDEQPTAAEASAVTEAGTRTILLVEDDPRVREATATALAELGHVVHAFASGHEALIRIAGDPAIALLMTDIVMPEMTGVELVQAAKALRPDLPVIFVTGFTGEASDPEKFRDGAVLRKPFTLRALGDALAAAFAAKQAS